ncbi:MAG: hypothetical protein GX841_02160, partial [Bacteroidales bacterium]|nr:hypothetical protein [Bacteroidales bacterium]
MSYLKSFFLIIVLIFALQPLRAIITDPEDHVYYFSGSLAPTRSFELPAFLGGQDWS